MPRETEQLVADLLETASDLESRGYLGSGLLRRAARQIAELGAGRAPDACQRCGEAVEQPATGRRRKYCHECHPRRGAKPSTNGTLPP
jgi:hypothetical protein